MTRTVKNRAGTEAVGYLTDVEGGTLAKDKHNRVLGRYNEAGDQTHDASGRFYGRGDLTLVLIHTS